MSSSQPGKMGGGGKNPRPRYNPRDGPEGGGNPTSREIILLKGHWGLHHRGDVVSNGTGATGSGQARRGGLVGCGEGRARL